MEDFLFGAVEVGSLAFCSYTFYRWHKRDTRLQDLMGFAQKASVMSPSMLARTMDYHGSEYLLKNIKGFEEGKNYSKGLAFVQGIIDSDQALRSVLNHSTKLVLSTVSSELIFSNNKNFEEIDGKIDTKLVSEFKLVDPTSETASLTVHNNSNVHFSDALHLIHSIVHMRSLSPLEKFLSWVLFCIKLFLSMSNVGKKLSGFKVGTKRVERGVMVGQFMIAFGDIVFNRYNKELRMNNPLFFLKDKEQLIYKLREQRVSHGRNMTLLLAVLIMLGIFVVKRMAKGGMTLVKKYKALQQLKTMDQFFKLRNLFTNDFRCTLCMENVRSVIFKPCLHLGVCQLCCEKMDEKKCPICKRGIEDQIKIFVS